MMSSRSMGILGVIAVLLIWFFITYFHFIDPLFLPSPSDVFHATISMFVNEKLMNDIFITMVRLIAGFSIGAIVGVVIGILMGHWIKMHSFFGILVDFCRSIPVMSLFPIFLVIFGLGEISKILIGAWSSSFLVLLNTIYGVRYSNQTRILMAKTMRANKLQVLLKIVIPGALPDIFAGLRIGVSIALIVIIMTEMLMGTQIGIGKKIIDAHLLYRIPEMYGVIIISGLIGYIVNLIFRTFEKIIIHWV